MRTTQQLMSAGATLTVAAVLGLSVAPAMASTTVAQATASALVLTVAGMPTDSGTYAVKNDGTKQTASGNHKPSVNALTGQSFISAGTLAQDATTSISGRNGISSACAGLAGDGATLAAAGDGSCLTPGRNLTLDAGDLDLSTLTISQSTLLMGLDTQLQKALQPVLDQVLPALQTALQTGLTALGNPGIFLDLGAIQTSCRATPTTASATAALADVSAYAKVMGTRVDLVSFPTNPKPNTKVVTGLGKVVDLIEAGLKKQLSTGLNGALGPLAGVIDQTTVLNNLIDNLSTQLAPLEQNVIDGTLNLQPKHARNQISATALDLDVLPVAKSFGVTALHVEIGKSTCGPDDRVALPTKTPSPHPTSTPHPHHHPGGMPTAVDAGLASAGPIDHGQGGVSPLGAAALAGILVLATGAGTAAYRRSMRS